MMGIMVLVVAFLLGSLPWSLWIARRYEIDIREHGSGNLGATNVYRVLGWRLGILVLALDIAKGTAAVALARATGLGGAMVTAAALAAVAGHMFTPFAGFRGGKGVATGMGVFLALAPVAASMSFLVWAAALALTGWVSVASGMGSLVLPFFVIWTREDLEARFPWVLWLSIFVAALILVRHRSNWKHLAEGREQRIWEHRPEDPRKGAPEIEEKAP